MISLAKDSIVGVVGLGYVGLPLAVAFGKRFRTIGYDISEPKVAAYRQHADPTGEVESDDLKASSLLDYTVDASLLAAADYIIVAVPTSVDQAHRPDFSPLISASTTVGRHMKRGAVVIFESTVFPGATEEICVPVLELHSGMKRREGFHVAYSPERINPGDREHTLSRVIKVVSADDEETLDRVAALYEAVVEAGVHRVSSIRVAEAAKVIENTQRDLNIALMNELAILFDRMGLDTTEVLQVAGTKWNFLKFAPGLVGGHCIGVDPYYLTHRAEVLGYHPQVILAGRRINDGMGKFIAEKTVKLMIGAGAAVNGASVSILGLTFKENCSDLRNSRVPDIIRELRGYGIEPKVHDPIASPEEARREYGIELVDWSDLPQADAIIVAVAHEAYCKSGAAALIEKLAPGGCIVDVKASFAKGEFPPRVFHWRL